MRDWICLSCRGLEQEEVLPHWEIDSYGWKRWRDTSFSYYCSIRYKNISTMIKSCPSYDPLTQIRLSIQEGDILKLDKLPDEGARIDLKDLPPEAELKAVSEKWIEEASGKAEGLAITFMLRDKRTFSQKYTKVSGTVLKQALKKLGLDDTESLQADWYLYELQRMRIGNDRMIPIKKVKA